MIEDDNITHPHQVAEIKQAFVEIYKDEYKPESTEDIFDDLNEIESVSEICLVMKKQQICRVHPHKAARNEKLPYQQ